jgi:hypothetical protein
MRIQAVTIFWGIIPTVVALLTCVMAVVFATRSRTILQVFGASIVVLSTVCSLGMLKAMFLDNAWPTYVPHILIGITAIIALVQWISVRRSPAVIHAKSPNTAPRQDHVDGS